VENNDFSHYQLGANIQGTHHIWRNNTFHDQLESEAGSNQHSDILYMEPNFTTGNIVLEGNFERNAVGPNAKQNLTQNDACSGSCTWGNVIERFNTVSRIGAAAITNDKSWPNIKVYNSTFVDEGMESSLTNGGDNMLSSGGGMAVLNSIWFSSLNFSNWNPYACSGCANYGHNLYWCTGTCTNVYGHQYGGGTFLGDPGNKNADPLFVSYVSAGSTSNNFHLQAGSPAIAAGTYLTTVASGDSGSGTSLVVSDATYFQDGYGLSNAYSTVNGDCIAVGTASNHVCVTTVNYTTNTLTLASSISRSAGQGVYLYSKSDGVQVLTGSAPNIGALGTAGSTPPVSITPSPVAFPNQTVGIQSSPLMVTVSNTGSATLTLNTPYFTVTGINAADFSNTGTGTCTNGGSVLAGNSCTALLIFTPSIEAAETATLNISGNANGSATINGTGIPTPPTTLTDIVKP
jgi:hypothetical protein